MDEIRSQNRLKDLIKESVTEVLKDLRVSFKALFKEAFEELGLVFKAIIKQAVREVLEESGRLQSQEWYDTDAAYKLLGLKNPEQLRKMVRDGRLQLGVQVVDIRPSGSEIARYQFNVVLCRERLKKPPEQRQIKRFKKAA